MNITYDLKIIQHNKIARVCSFKEKSRRSCRPPPILKLDIYEDGSLIDVSANYTGFVVIAFLLEFDPKTGETENNHLNPKPKHPLKIEHLLNVDSDFTHNSSDAKYIRSATSQCYLLKGLDEKLGRYFIFDDFFINKPGSYKMEYRLVDIGKSTQEEPHSNYLCSVRSEMFVAYSASVFPGNDEISELCKCFIDQGVKLDLKKKTRKSSSSSKYK